MTLTELMIALVLGALVVLAATAMVVTSRSTYHTQDETTRMAESARFGLELSNRLIRMVGYTNFGDDDAVPASYKPDPLWAAAPNSYAFNGPNLVGANGSKPTSGAAINGSDSLTIRYFGSSGALNPAVADGSVLDCAGLPVPQAPAAATAAIANVARSYNVLFVDTDSDGEPALKCQRQTYDATTGLPSGVGSDTQTLIRGVEVFQVLYGEIIPKPLPNDQDFDNPGVEPGSIAYRTGLGGPNPVVVWSNVKSVRIALLLRSAIGARTEPEPTTTVYKLFGDYPTASDTGTTFSVAALSAADRTRLRRVVETTIFVRNRVADWSLQAP